MIQTYTRTRRLVRTIVAVVSLSTIICVAHPPHAWGAASPNPQSGSIGLEGTISAPAPTRPATISSPAAGRSYSALPIDVAGLCPQGTVVKLFSNNIFIGAVKCTNGSYSLQADLFSGQNELIARVYDDLDQAGPDSTAVTVTYKDADLDPLASRVSLTSIYAKRGASPGETLTWPVIVSGGNNPYAMTVDWGDGKPVLLKSVPFSGNINLDHVYDAAGTYRIIVKASDTGGSTAYLQLIGVGTGAASASGSSIKDGSSGATNTVTVTKYSLLPYLIAFPLIIITFWLGGKHQKQVLRRRIEDSEQNSATS